MKIHRLTIRLSLKSDFIVFILFFSACALCSAQTKRLAELPASDVYILIMNQPGNPLLIINPHVYYNVDAKRVGPFSFGVRNTGKKPIAGFQVGVLWDMGSGGTLETSWDYQDTKKTLQPDQQIDEVDPEQFQSVSITPEIREQLKFKSSPGRLLFYFVSYVQFKDGTKLEFHDQMDNLSTFLRNNYWDKNQE